MACNQMRRDYCWPVNSQPCYFDIQTRFNLHGWIILTDYTYYCRSVIFCYVLTLALLFMSFSIPALYYFYPVELFWDNQGVHSKMDSNENYRSFIAIQMYYIYIIILFQLYCSYFFKKYSLFHKMSLNVTKHTNCSIQPFRIVTNSSSWMGCRTNMNNTLIQSRNFWISACTSWFNSTGHDSDTTTTWFSSSTWHTKSSS